MFRYLIEVKYKGTAYGGFQIQENVNTVQAEVEKALSVFFRMPFELTGSSRTDAGVHALQNYFHFDTEVDFASGRLQSAVYHINAILPEDIVLLSIISVKDDFHCRFNALSREYHYHIYRQKDPFMQDRGYFFPYKLDIELLDKCAAELMQHTHFESFAKKNSQVKTFACTIYRSEWVEVGDSLIYKVEANRFLRGMVRGLVGTMLRAGAGKLNIDDFTAIITGREQSKADFSVPPQGLFLMHVRYPKG